VKPIQKDATAPIFHVGSRVSERRACRLADVARSGYGYRNVSPDQSALRLRLRDSATTRVRDRHHRLHILLRREGCLVNHQRVSRGYREEGLGI
jgi:putative transposase